MEEGRHRYRQPPSPALHCSRTNDQAYDIVQQSVGKTLPTAPSRISDVIGSYTEDKHDDKRHNQADQVHRLMPTPPTSDKTTPIEASGRPSASPVSFSISVTPSDHIEVVSFSVLVEATRNFDRTPYKDGGHKVGEGGFGEVFQCLLPLRNGTVHAAVKVLLNKVRNGASSLLLYCEVFSLSTAVCVIVQGEPDRSADKLDSLDSMDRRQFSTEIEALSK